MDQNHYNKQLTLLWEIKNKASLSLGKSTPNGNAAFLFNVGSLIVVGLFGPMLAREVAWPLILMVAIAINLLVYTCSAQIFKQHAHWKTYVYELLAQVEPVNKAAFDELKHGDVEFGYDARRVIEWCELEIAEIKGEIAAKKGDAATAEARARFMKNDKK